MLRKCLHILLAFLILGSFVNAVAPTVAVVDPDGDGNYLRHTQRITFTVLDVDANSNVDSNLFADIYLSATAGAKTTLIINDLNLMNTARCVDQNFASQNTCTVDFNFATNADGNFFLDVNVADWTVPGVVRDSALDSSAGSFAVDKTVPAINFISPSAGATVASKVMQFDVNDAHSPITLSSISVKLNSVTSTAFTSGDCTKVGDKNYNCSYTETGISSDGNFTLTVSANDFATNASGDTNRAFTYDASVSGITFVSPSAAEAFLNIFTVTVRWTNPDSDVATYWVRLDSDPLINNSTNTSYTFGGLTIGTHTVTVIATDNLDNNSATGTITFGIRSGGGGPSCGNNVCDETETAVNCAADCAPVCGDGACTGIESSNTCPVDCGPIGACGNNVCESGENYNLCPQDCDVPKGQLVRETVLTRETTGKPSADDIRRLLEQAGASANAIQKATNAVSKTNVSRKFEVIKEKREGEAEKFTTIVEIRLQNKSNNILENVKVIEEIPKEAVERARNVASSAQFRVIKDDPLVEFTIDSIAPNETKSIKYSFDDSVDNETIAKFQSPIVADFDENEPLSCSQLNCNDTNPCTNDSCENAKCFNIPKPNGESCAAGMVCSAGKCTAQSITDVSQPQNNIAFIIGAIVVVAVLAYMFFRKK